MPWARLDDRANSDAKLLALSDSAWRMWGCGMIYCQFNLTDGFIPTHAIETFGVRARHKAAIADELCRSLVPGKGPLWHRVEGGFQVHDFLQWNDSKEKVAKDRAASIERVQRFRQRVRSGVTNGDGNALQTPNVHLSTTTTTDVRSTDHERTSRPRTGTGPGVMAGTLPRDHLRHAFCDRVCVPAFLHAQFVAQFGGDPKIAAQTLGAFYRRTIAAIPADQPIGDEPLRFWRQHFAAAHPCVAPTRASTVTPARRAQTDARPTEAWDDITIGRHDGD